MLDIVGGRRTVSGIRSVSGIIKTLDGITVYPPAQPGDPWRAAFYDRDGKRKYRQAADEDGLARKLDPVKRRLAGLPDLNRFETASGADLIAYYLSPDRLPADRQWSSSYRADQERFGRKTLEVIGDVPCGAIETWHMQQIVNRANTATSGARLRTFISGLIKIGGSMGFLTEPLPAVVHWQAGDRPRPTLKARICGESTDFIDMASLPRHRDVSALALATQQKRLCRWWRELMPYVAAYSGIRRGEMLALSADDVDSTRRTITVLRKVIEVNGKQTIELPKNGIIRTTLFPEIAPDGYRLADMLARRINEARTERDAGSNPNARLFPARGGKYMYACSFYSSIAEPAFAAAGWRTPESGSRWTWHTLRHVFCTTALVEWKLDLTDVSKLAGHSTIRITADRYVGAVAGTLERAFERTRVKQAME
ncbi:site-specific recombinase XerD [Catenulispora sp. EB89]|uniref:tyrosine-type recombinase/integrase n=1 Tax=Catenulispora sp. EB89 TaxID=3156257 RepID=UPI003517409D